MNLIYIPLGASFLLFLIGQFLAGIVAYPYSSSFFNKSYQRQSNFRIGIEFVKCVERMTRLIVDMQTN